MSIKAIRNHIVFRFLDSLSNNDVKQFTDTTDWGFKITRIDDSMQSPRWVKIISLGPEVPSGVSPGDVVLLEPLRWTVGFKHNGVEYWRSDSTALMAIDEGSDQG